MKKRLFLSIAVVLACATSLLAQPTALVAYEGGYFIKNDNKWVEYRPADKLGPWNEYKQYRESDTFYFLNSKRCRVAIPKLARDKIFVDRKKNEKWEVVYNTVSVHQVAPKENGLFYCYKTTSIEYDGYFVRYNGKWHEYRPNMKRGVWAEFRQTGEDEKFFILESDHNIVNIPKTTADNISIKKKDNSSWRGGYRIAAIYDRAAAYDYSFIYKNSFVAKKRNNFEQALGDARISFDRRGNIQISYNGKFYDFKYRSMKPARLENGNIAICISIDDKNNVWICSQEQCIVDCKSIGKKMTFIGCDNKDGYNEINELLNINPIYFWGD